MAYSIPGKTRRRFRALSRGLGKYSVALALFISVYLIFTSPLAPILSNLQLRSFFKFRGPIVSNSEVVVIAIDQQSFENENLSGLQNWPRALLAEAIEGLKSAGVRIAVIDLLLDPNSTFPDADPLLERALKSFPTTLAVLNYAESFLSADGSKTTTRYDRKPNPNFAAASKFLPLMMVRADSDQVVRRFYLENGIPPLAQVSTWVLGVNQHQTPISDDLINFYGPQGTLPTIPIYQLLGKNLKPQLADYLKNKIAVLGHYRKMQSDSMSEDQHLTVFGKTFGVEIHATVLANLLEQNWIHRIPKNLDFLITSVLTILVCFFSIGRGPLWGSVTAILSAVALGLISYTSFLFGKFFNCSIYILIVVPLLVIGIMTFHYITTMRAFKRIEKALGISLKPPA